MKKKNNTCEIGVQTFCDIKQELTKISTCLNAMASQQTKAALNDDNLTYTLPCAIGTLIYKPMYAYPYRSYRVEASTYSTSDISKVLGVEFFLEYESAKESVDKLNNIKANT